VSTYANDGPVMGYTEEGCTGDWVWASSFSGLYDYHDEYDFKSYLYTSDPDACYVFEEAITVTGTPEPSTDTGGGDSGGVGTDGRSGNSNPTPRVGGGANPMGMLHNERNQELKDCWIEKLVETDVLEDWTGKYNKEKWSTDTGATWQVSSEDNGALGYTKATHYSNNSVSINVFIYPQAIFNQSQGSSPTFKHLAIYAQMEEYVHTLQIRTEADDGDETYVPPPHELFNMELGAAVDVEKWWRAIFGFGPPILKTIYGPGGQHRRKTRRYKEYKQQLADDKELADDHPDKLTADEKETIEGEIEELREWFEDPENLPKQTGPSVTYNPEQDIDCEEEEEEE